MISTGAGSKNVIAENVDWASVDTCEGARWSAYISPGMVMTPCSFDGQNMRFGIDLRSGSIQEACNSSVFEGFRDKFRTACPECTQRDDCMGGCPISPSIVLCEKVQRN